jgi:hypothetical protein
MHADAIKMWETFLNEKKESKDPETGQEEKGKNLDL